MEKEEGWIESIDEVKHFLKKTQTFLANVDCQLDIQRDRRDEDPLDPNTTRNTLLDLGDVNLKDELLSLTVKDYVKTVKDRKRKGDQYYRIFTKQVKGRNIYIKFKICNLSKIHLMSFHYAKWDLEDRPYK
jgi:hypothetical protein